MDQRDVIEQILDIEADMFRRVPTREEPSCRAFMEDMKMHRRGQFAGWSAETCACYLEDLRRARRTGRNLMTLKYARMDDLVPPLTDNPLVGRIRDRYVSWQRQLQRDYPGTLRQGRDLEDFARYLSGELETYSDATLASLWGDVKRADREGRNLSREVYESLARQAGFDTLADLEDSLKH